MLLIPVPEIAYAENKLQLGGTEYTFIWSFNERDYRWRFSLYLADEPVILGIKVMESQSLLSRYLLEGFSHGDLFCVRTGSSFEDVGRDNLGIGKNYEIIYLSNAEIAELGG